MKTTPDPNLGHTATKELQRIFSALLDQESAKFVASNSPASASTGLHLFCGNGLLSIDLARKLGEDCTLLAVYDQEEDVEGAKKILEESPIKNLSFCAFEAWKAEPPAPQFDFIFGRLLFAYQDIEKSVLAHLQHSLLPKGQLLLEEFNLRNIGCFPYSSVFNRCQEIVNNFTPTKADCSFYECIHDEVVGAGFAEPESRFRSPIFLRPPHKNVLSLLFESIMYKAHQMGVANPLETNTLLAELKAFEQFPHSMVSLPGVYEIRSGLAES